MAGFGSSIKLDGENEYQRALKQINQSLREVSSEMKVVSSSFDKNDKSTQAMAQKSDVLNKALEQQQAKLSVLTTKYNEMNATYGKNSQAQQQLTAELTKEKAKLINYSTPLAIYYNGIFTINTKKYSRTTSKIQSYIKNYVESHNLQNVIFSDLF